VNGRESGTFSYQALKFFTMENFKLSGSKFFTLTEKNVTDILQDLFNMMNIDNYEFIYFVFFGL